MKMTPEQLRQNAGAMIACAEGKPVEARGIAPITDWLDQSFPISFNFEQVEYRPKPEPVTRPWSKPQDVPAPVCWVRTTSMSEASATRLEGMVVAVSDKAMTFLCGSLQHCDWDNRELAHLEYSTDRKTWHKCEVTEEPK